MFCPKCGSKLSENAPFCSSCGNKVAYPSANNAPFENNQFAQQTNAAPAPAYQAATPINDAIYPMSEKDKNLYLANFVLCIISTVCFCWTFLALAWMIPMTIYSYRIYQGKKANTTAFAVLTLIFVSLAGGICLLLAEKKE